MRVRAVLLAVALVLVPLAARAADLVVWWEKGFYPEEDAAVAELVAAFEAGTGKTVELVQPAQDEMSDKAQAALKAGQPPDFLFGTLGDHLPQWAYEDRLVNLEGVLGPVLGLFDADILEAATLLNGRTGERDLYALPMGRNSNHVHVWKSVLERAGFRLEDVPKEWKPFWSFWCDKVQPAVRRALGREDVWGVGLVMSVEAADTEDQFFQFVQAADANYVSRDGKLLIDDPEVRRRLVTALSSYTEVWRKGCTPPDALTWKDPGNNKAFLAQRVVVTPNITSSITTAIKAERPSDYYENTATIEWPLGPGGNRFPIVGDVFGAVVFAAAGHVAAAEDFARFLVEEGWLAHSLAFADDRSLPPMKELLDQPFWLN